MSLWFFSLRLGGNMFLFSMVSINVNETSRHFLPQIQWKPKAMWSWSWITIFRRGNMAKNEYEKLNSEEDAKNVNPVINANIFSRLTIWWMNKIFVTGNKRPLEEEDLFPLLEEDKSEVLTEKLQTEWEKELNKRHHGKRPRFWKALMRVCPWYEYFSIIGLVMTDMANRMTLPVLLGFLISYLMGIRQLDVSFKYILPTFICITSLGRNLAQHHYQNRSALLGMRFRAAATGLLYKKVSTRSIALKCYEEHVFERAAGIL